MPWGQKISPRRLLVKDQTRTQAGPSKTPALNSSSLPEGNFVLPSEAQNALLHEAPHTSTFLLTGSRDKPASLVKPACITPALSPFPHLMPCLPHAPLLLCQRFGLADSSLLPPPVVPTALPHSTCCLTGLVALTPSHMESSVLRIGGMEMDLNTSVLEVAKCR